ncbi:MAG: S41 family peptidase [Rubripirellula sp.]
MTTRNGVRSRQRVTQLQVPRRKMMETFGLIAILLTLVSPAMAADVSKAKGDPAGSDPSDQMASQLLQVFDLVLQQHLDPPTRQEMVLGSIEKAYAARATPMPASMSMQVSDATSRQKLQDLLADALAGRGLAYTPKPLKGLPHQLREFGVDINRLKAQRVNEQMAANRYVGIGIAIMKSDAQPVMATIMPGGAAAKAECQKGDQIISVNGKDTSGIPLETVIEWIRGPEGTDVEIGIRRGALDEMLTMTRGVIPMKTLSEPVPSDAGKIVGIAIQRVSASNVHELRKVAASLDESVAAVVLDLRTSQDATNLHYGMLLGNALIDDQEIGQLIDRGGKSTTVRAEPGSLFAGSELFVVIGQKTGSVLKWIAAATQDTNSAVLLGLPAIENCFVTEVTELPAASLAVTIPTQRLARAGGESLSSSKQWHSASPILNPLNPKVKGILFPDRQLDSRFRRSPSGRFPTVAMTARDMPLTDIFTQIQKEFPMLSDDDQP